MDKTQFVGDRDVCLELDHLSLPLLVSSELEVLGALDGELVSLLALLALNAEHDLLGGLGLESGTETDLE